MSVRRDYKPIEKTRRQVRYGILVVITLMLIGLFGSLLVYLRSQRPEQAPTPLAESVEAQPETPSAPPRPQYDFYTLLPGREVLIRQDEIERRPLADRTQPPLQREGPKPSLPRTEESPSTRNSGGYTIQAGSFRSAADADRRKASLALLGVSARIEVTTGPDHATWHRVRIGPFKDPNQAQALRQRLQQEGIQSIAIQTP